MNKINVTCKGCDITYEVTRQSAKRNKTGYCRKCHSKHIQSGIKRPQFSGENSKRWGGGEYISSDGYIMIKIPDKFLESGRQVYKRQHIVLYEQHIGRELKTTKGGAGEQIHHIDGNKQNNGIDNLLLCKNVSEHRLIHDSLEKVALELYKKGVIKFNKELKKYYL